MGFFLGGGGGGGGGGDLHLAGINFSYFEFLFSILQVGCLSEIILIFARI